MCMYMYVSYEIVLRSQTKESLAAFYSVVLFNYLFILFIYLSISWNKDKCIICVIWNCSMNANV